MMRLAALLLATTSVYAQDYTSLLSGLWKQSDANEDGVLSQAEFLKAAKKLDLKPTIFTSHGNSLETFYAAIDTDGSGGLTKKELADSITNFPEYKDPLASAFTNGANKMPNPANLLNVPASVVAAKATVKMSLELAGSISDLYAGTRNEIISYFATTCGVTTADVIVTFLPKTTTGRRLQSSGGGVMVDGTAFVADNAAVAAAQSALPTDAAGFAAVPAFSDLTVTSASVSVRTELSIPIVPPIIVGVILVGAGIFLCVFASTVAKKKAATAGASGGCCSTGCCSFYAVKPWAAGEFLALIAIAGTVFFLYSNMQSLTTTILGLIDAIIAFATSTSTIVSGIAAALPSSIIQLLQDQRSIVALLPFAVMGPGALCIVFLLLAFILSCSSGHKGSYCFSKCCIMLANIFLLLSFIFYIIFVALALALELSPPSIKLQIKSATSICDTLPPTINQVLADAQGTLSLMQSAGATVPADLQSTLTDVQAISTIITTGCGHVSQLFVDIYNLFLPGLTCVVAILFAMFVNNTLCCAEGCCKAPPKAGTSSKGVVEMTQEV